MGTRVDAPVTVDKVEFLCEEDKASDDSTKILEERHFKVAMEIKDVLWDLFQCREFDRIKIKIIVIAWNCNLQILGLF